KEVGCELHATECAVDRGSKGFCEACLTDARSVFEQHVSFGDEREHHVLDHFAFAADRALDAVTDPAEQVRERLGSLRRLLSRQRVVLRTRLCGSSRWTSALL